MTHNRTEALPPTSPNFLLTEAASDAEQTGGFAEVLEQIQMRDRLSELLDLAQRERLTPEDSEELARMLKRARDGSYARSHRLRLKIN